MFFVSVISTVILGAMFFAATFVPGKFQDPKMVRTRQFVILILAGIVGAHSFLWIVIIFVCVIIADYLGRKLRGDFVGEGQ